MRVALLAVLFAVVWAAPAAAQFSPPTVIKFAAGQMMPISDGGATLDAPCGGATVATGGWDGGAFLRLPDIECSTRLFMTLPARQVSVELFVRAQKGSRVDVSLCGPQLCSPDLVAEASILSATGDWQPLAIATANDAPTVYGGRVSSSGGTVEVDDIAFSGIRQPDTRITVTTASVTSPTPATFTFDASSAPVTYRCSVDGGAYATCSNPATVAGLAPGTHSLRVYAVDVYGATDEASPAAVDFIVNQPNPPAVADADADGRPDSADNCPANANSDQADADADGVGNACEVLPPGNVPPKPGETSVVQVVSGEVFVKLPTRTALGFDGMRAPFQDGGFVSLKGVASVPLGSTVDTRKGEVSIKSAANSYASTDRRAKQQQARIKAALFLLKQKRAKAKSASISTDISLLSPPAAESRCVGAPAKGTVVRSISMVVKGYYRTLGGASTGTARSATFNTTDRCDGTLTEVGRGTVTLAVKGKPNAKPIRVRAGRAYLVKAKLFAVRKGRSPEKGRP